MGKKSQPAPPPAPNPQAVAAAQTGSNVTTGISNSILQNADTVGPYGKTSNAISGYEAVTDPSTGTTYQVPRFTQTTTLDPAQQGLLNQQNQLSSTLNNVGIEQAGRIGGMLGQPISTAGLPGMAGAPSMQNASGMFGNTSTKVQTGLGNTKNSITGSFAGTKPMDFQIGANDFSADRTKVEDALMSRLNPQIERDRGQLENTLINQGFVRGTEGFNQAMDELNRSSTDARMQAVLAGGQEQSRLFGLEQAAGQFQNAAVGQDYQQNLGRAAFQNEAQGQEFGQLAQRGTFANAAQEQEYNQLLGRANIGNAAAAQNNQSSLAAAGLQNQTRQQSLQEMLAVRNQPINEISALMSGGQVSLPGVTPYQSGQIQNTPVGDYYYQNANMANQQWMAQMQAQQQQQAGLYGALGSLGGAGLYGLARSDRRIKTGIRQIGELENGLPLYRFRFIDAPTVEHVGLMAQDVELVMPEAVVTIGGIKHVNYAMAVR